MFSYDPRRNANRSAGSRQWYGSSTLGAETRTPARTWQLRVISRHLDINSIVKVRQSGYVVDAIQVVCKKGKARPRSQKLSDYPSPTEPDSVPPLRVLSTLEGTCGVSRFECRNTKPNRAMIQAQWDSLRLWAYTSGTEMQLVSLSVASCQQRSQAQPSALSLGLGSSKHSAKYGKEYVRAGQRSCPTAHRFEAMARHTGLPAATTTK